MKKSHIAFMRLLMLSFMMFLFTTQLQAQSDVYSIGDYIITYGQAGPFTLNSAFPGEGEYKGFKIVKKQKTRYAEDGADELTVYHAQKEGVTHIIIYPKPDNPALIDELEVVSPLYETKAGIGAGSSINDFYEYYTEDVKGYYTFISGMYWLKTYMDGIQFLIDERSYLGTPDDSSDLTILAESKLDRRGRITKIRIY